MFCNRTSKRTLEEHIAIINQYQLKKACIIAENIDFLVCCPSLEYLEIIPARTAREDFDYSPLYRMQKIRTLCVDTEYGDYDKQNITSIDYSRINGLEEITIRGKGHKNYNKIDTVKTIQFYNHKMTDLTVLKHCRSLKSLGFMNTGIKSVDGIEELKDLQLLDLDHERALSDMSSLFEVSQNLKVLSIECCPKIRDFSFLEKMRNLEFLTLNGSNKIPDLEFLKKMPKLKMFIFSMEVENGNLEPCLHIPYVSCNKNRKSYNLKDKDLPKKYDGKGFELNIS